MSALIDIEKEVLSLPEKEYSDFRQWFYSYDFKDWDNKIKKDFGKHIKLSYIFSSI